MSNRIETDQSELSSTQVSEKPQKTNKEKEEN